MERDRECTPEIISLCVNDIHLANFVDLNKKRKLQDEQLGWPLPKHKFRNRCCCFEHVSPVAKDPTAEEIYDQCMHMGKIERGEFSNGSEESQSVVDSNSFTGESDTLTPINIEFKTEIGFLEAYISGQSSASSVSSSIDNFQNSNTIKRTNGTEQVTSTDGDPNRVTSETGLLLEPGSPSSRDQLDGFGEYPNYFYSEYGGTGKGPCSEMETDEIMLYSNGVTSNLYVLSSGRWSINKDARPSARKPTIDQEFEQYFSKLML